MVHDETVCEPHIWGRYHVCDACVQKSPQCPGCQHVALPDIEYTQQCTHCGRVFHDYCSLDFQIVLATGDDVCADCYQHFAPRCHGCNQRVRDVMQLYCTNHGLWCGDCGCRECAQPA